MTFREILSHVDHTLLKADASYDQIRRLCDEAVESKTASVCIPPSYVTPVKKDYRDKINVCTVIGFPLGYSVSKIKEAELGKALDDGASEFDMVVNIGDVKNKNFKKITQEITALKELAGGLVLKVIVETCYLTDDEKISLCSCVTDAGADYIKTSTGFGTAGAALSDIELFKKHIGPGVKIKAAGGIRSREDMVEFIQAGCERLGTSSAVKILTGGGAGAY
jgi:deoxyribose-phosphate aldolase